MFYFITKVNLIELPFILILFQFFYHTVTTKLFKISVDFKFINRIRMINRPSAKKMIYVSEDSAPAVHSESCFYCTKIACFISDLIRFLQFPWWWGMKCSFSANRMYDVWRTQDILATIACCRTDNYSPSPISVILGCLTARSDRYTTSLINCGRNLQILSQM